MLIRQFPRNAFCGRSSFCGKLLQHITHQAYSSENVANEEKTADFGFRKVPETEKSRLVGEVFTNVAETYDLMNDVMSAGLHRLWKDRFVAELRPFPGIQLLDVAGGTGDIAFRALASVLNSQRRGGRVLQSNSTEGGDTQIVVCDINPAMLEVGKQRAKAKGWGSHPALVWMEGNAESLEMKSNSMDAYTIAFGIRNVTKVDAALREAHRVLRPGGRFLCLELSHVESPVFQKLYDLYSFEVVPRLGAVIANDRDSYQYLVESIRKFPKQEKFAQMITNAGFSNVTYENLTGGIVAIHTGFKI